MLTDDENLYTILAIIVKQRGNTTMERDHKKIWQVIDMIAYINGISVSALARRAGLDSTAFNRSKRKYPSGKYRWPSSESICRVLKVTGMDWGRFCRYMEEAEVMIEREESKKDEKKT